MDDALGMSKGQGVSNLDGNIQAFTKCQRCVGLDPGAEIDDWKVLHDNERRTSILFDGKDREDVLMMKASH